MDGEQNENYTIGGGVGVRQECVMLPWLFSNFMNGCLREMKAIVGNVIARMGWAMVACLFANKTVIC